MSKAIRIQAPPPSPPRSPSLSSDPLRPSSTKGSKLCRNMVLDGVCRNEDCVFQHPPKSELPSSASSPVVSPLIPRSTLSVQHAAAPAFVPKGVVTLELPGSAAGSQLTSPTLSAATPAFVIGAGRSPTADHAEVIQGTLNGASEAFTQLSLGAQPFNPSSSSTTQQPLPLPPPDLGVYGDLEPYYPPPPLVRQPLDYHLYTTPLPHITNLHPSQTPIHTFFLSPTLREDLQRRSSALSEVSPVPVPGLPDELHVYHSLAPLEPSQNGPEGKNKRVFGLGTEVWKAICEMDGNAYVLRRVEGFKIQHDGAFAPIEAWRRIRHPNVVSVREAFTTRLFGDHSVIFAYDYHPTSRTLFTEHFTPKPPAIGKNGRLQPQEMHVPEKVIWSYVTQLCNALKAIHSEGLAARMVDPSKILVTGRNRIRINCCGILDVVAYDGGQNLIHHQQEDLQSLGKLILALTNLSLSAIQNLPKALEILSRSYSLEIKNLVLFLLSKPGPKGIDEVLSMLGARVLNELDAAMNYADILESEMTRELENGRLVRLLCKFGFINERPEFDHDPRWSESGDRYILKLFRDMVFHQVDEMNKPVLDLSHVLTCLNKLDSGSDEKVMLMSRDEQSCLVVSYREIKSAVEAAFNDLARGSSV